MTTYYNTSPKMEETLKQNDTVIFTVRGVNYEYEVRENGSGTYLYHKEGYNNQAIFNALGIDAESFCGDAYCYTPRETNLDEWPEADKAPGGYAALTRCVRALMAKCEEVNSPSLISAAEALREAPEKADEFYRLMRDRTLALYGKSLTTFGWTSESPDPTFLGYPIKLKSNKSLMNTINTFAKKILDTKTKTLIKAGFLDSELNPTGCGQEALAAILWQEKLDLLVAAAEEQLAEAKSCE